MINDIFGSIGAAARKIFSNWAVLLIALVIYEALLAVLYFFISTGEATALEVVLTVLVLPALAVFLFFMLQALGVSYVRIGVGPLYVVKRAFNDCWKILVVSLPIMLLIGLIWHYGDVAELHLIRQSYQDPPPSGQWKLPALQWTRYFLLYFVLPLLSIHLWIAAVREGIAGAFKSIGRVLATAYSLRSILIYLVVIAIFGALAYLFFMTRIRMDDAWIELWLFGVRQMVALLIVFLGWFIAVGALAEMTARSALKEIEE